MRFSDVKIVSEVGLNINSIFSPYSYVLDPDMVTFRGSACIYLLMCVYLCTNK
jgi:hypothetical protein